MLKQIQNITFALVVNAKQNILMIIEIKKFNIASIVTFAEEIDRDPGIVLGRLQNDGFVDYNDWRLGSLKHQYKVKALA